MRHVCDPRACILSPVACACVLLLPGRLPSCRSILGPKALIVHKVTTKQLGADSEVAAHMVLEDVGCVINFRDPFVIHPWGPDTDSLVRLVNVDNVMHASNPTTACALMAELESALESNKMDGLPSFTKTLQSPAVAEYKRQQDAVIAACQARGGSTPSVAASQPPSVAEPEELIKVSASEFLNNYVPGATGAKFDANPVRVVKWANRAKKKVTTEQGAHAKEAAKRMRCLALVSHNNMKAAMQDFVVANQHVLRRFRLDSECTRRHARCCRVVRAHGMHASGTSLVWTLAYLQPTRPHKRSRSNDPPPPPIPGKGSYPVGLPLVLAGHGEHYEDAPLGAWPRRRVWSHMLVGPPRRRRAVWTANYSRGPGRRDLLY